MTTPLIDGKFAVLLIIIGTLLGHCFTHKTSNANNNSSSSSPSTPKFADNYHVSGILSLPYAELNEPFEAFYDKQLDRSRTDYYHGEYKVYQFGPKSAPDASSSQYGAIYKLLYVPKSFHINHNHHDTHQSTQTTAKRLLNDAYEKVHDFATKKELRHKNRVELDDMSEHSRTPIKRVCFGVNGGVGYTIQAQTVLPSLDDFTYDSTGMCPQVADSEHKHAKCELWKLTTNVGDKRNVYKFWLRRDEQTYMPIPVHYYMLGYDKLLGSHYDRYDISYFHYGVNEAHDNDFKLDIQDQTQCGSMPGPGDDAYDGEKRAHMIVQNPIHEFVVEPHKYNHIDHHFNQFKEDFTKSNLYENEKHERKSWFNFMHNLRFIHGKNRELREFKLKVNQYADENVRELRYLRGRLHSTGYNGGLDYAKHHPELKRAGGGGGDLNGDLPDTFDWTVLGAVTPVKDQAVCGSCWSFGTVGSLEGAYFKKTGKLLKLSQQQLIDCSWQYGNNGCDGGEDFRAYKYIKDANGLSTEEEYGHYLGIDGKCHDQDVEKPVKIKDFYNVTANSVDALKHAIVNYGPVSISIDASRPTFTFYSHGAYYDEKCKNSPDSLDHAVLAVGYTKINGKLVWKVKNSWSTYWGNDGYIYMLAENNNCGVLDAPTVPIVVV